MLDINNKIQVLAEVKMPTSGEFKAQIEKYESDAISYFSLIMGVTIIASFLKGLMR